MEIEGGLHGSAAREHLAELNDAMRTSTVAGAAIAPSWGFAAVALVGPAFVFYIASRDGVGGEPAGDFFRVGWIVLGVLAVIGVVAGAVASVRSSSVRPKSPARGGRTTKWAFIASLAVTLPIHVGGGFLDGLIDGRPVNAVVLSVIAYVWLAIVPAYFYRRHAAALGQVRAL